MQHEVHSDHMYQQPTPATVPVRHDNSILDDEHKLKATGDDISRDQHHHTQHEQLDSKLTPAEVTPVDEKRLGIKPDGE